MARIIGRFTKGASEVFGKVVILRSFAQNTSETLFKPTKLESNRSFFQIAELLEGAAGKFLIKNASAPKPTGQRRADDDLRYLKIILH